MKIIRDIEGLKYKVELIEEIKITGGGDNSLLPELIEQLREQKKEAIAYLRKRKASTNEKTNIFQEDLILELGRKYLKAEKLKTKINLTLKENNYDKDLLIKDFIELVNILY